MSNSFGLIRCHIGDEAYCFEMSSVVSVCRALSMQAAEAPGAGDPIGWVKSATASIPVFGLAERLGRAMPILHPRQQQIVVIKTSQGLQGFLVDLVSRVISVPVEQVQPLPMLLNNPARRLFKSVVLFKHDGAADSMSLVLSAERLPHNAEPVIPDRRPNAVADTSSMEDASPVGQTEWLMKSGRIVLFPLARAALDGRAVLCGLSTAQVVEVSDPRPLVPVPMAPPQIAGFIVWRQKPVPVLRFDARFSPPMESPTRCLVIVRHAGELLALPTPDVLRARRLPLPHQPCSLPSGLHAEVILGAFQADSEVLVIPNLARLMRPRSTGVA